MSDQTKFLLNESDLPRFWYNINADSPLPPTPVLRPDTLEPVTPDFLSVLFPMELILQEVSTERFIPIPEEVREIYKLYRPTPLLRARRLEKALGTTGAHLLQERRRLAGGQPQTEHGHPAGLLQQGRRHEGAHHRDRRRAVGLGAGPGLQLLWPGPRSLHGQGLVPAEALPPHDDGDLRSAGVCQPHGPHELWAARCWQKDPDSPGSLGIAISEAVEVAATSGGKKKYSLGSVLNHVLMHQSVIGEEALKQMDHGQ